MSLLLKLTALSLLCVVTGSAQTWQAVNNGLGADSSVRVIIVPKNGDLFMGMGDGILRSTNHGGLWTQLVPSGLVTVQSLESDAAGRIYGGTDHSMYLSTDNGNNWTPINNGLPDSLITAIAIADSGRIFAGVDVGALYTSTDIGANWTPGGNGIASSDIAVLAYFGNKLMLAGLDGGGMFRSTDNGNHWVASSTGLTDLFLRALLVTHTGVVFAGTNSDGIFRSVDSGKTWVNVNSNITNTFIASLVEYAPGGLVYVGTSGGGVFRTSNNGGSWTEVNTGLGNLLVDAMAVDSSGYIYAGTAISGVYRSSTPVTSVDPPAASLPAKYGLLQNYPNPFNPSTTISYNVGVGAAAQVVTLKVYDLLGRVTATLVSEKKEPGQYSVVWDAAGAGSGVYYCVMSAGTFRDVRKLVVMK